MAVPVSSGSSALARSTAATAARTPTSRPGPRCRALRDSGSSRSFPQRSDGRQAHGGYVTLGGRKSVLLLLFCSRPSSSLPPSPPPLLPSPSPSPPSSRPPPSPFLLLSTDSHLHRRSSPHLNRGLFTNKSSHLSNGFYDSAPALGSPGSTIEQRRRSARSRAGRCKREAMSSRSAAGGCSLDCIAQNCRQPPERRPKKATRPSASRRNCRDVFDLSVHPSIHLSTHPSFRPPARSLVRSVSFVPRAPLDLVLCNARVVPFLTSSPSLFLSPGSPSLALDLLSRARVSPLSPSAPRYLSHLPSTTTVTNVVVSTWNRLRNSFESEI